MGSCSIRKCKTRSQKGGNIMFHTFPKNASVAKEWLRFCGARTNSKNGRVCSKHFTPSDYMPKSLRCILMNEPPGKKERTLKPDAVPKLFINGESEETTSKDELESVDNPSGNSDVAECYQFTDSQGAGTSTDINECEIKDPIFVAVGENDDSDDFGLHNHDTITIPIVEYKGLKEKVCELEKTVSEYNIFKQNLEKIFTPGQIRCLLKPEMNRVKWSAEDIAAALSLKCVSPNGYKYLKTILGVPLPGYSTLSKWEAKYHKRKEH